MTIGIIATLILDSSEAKSFIYDGDSTVKIQMLSIKDAQSLELDFESWSRHQVLSRGYGTLASSHAQANREGNEQESVSYS